MLPVYRPPRPRGASPPCQMANPTLNSEAQDSASMISFSDENPPPNPTSDNGGLWPIKKGEFSPNESQSDGEGSVGFQERKKHRRRPSKRRRPWKPYHNLNWEEKQQVDKKQSQRASRIQAEMFAKGHPVAPYNTTQFLMEDHNQEEPDLKIGLSPKRAAIKSDETSEEDFMELEGSNRIGPDGTEKQPLGTIQGNLLFSVPGLLPPCSYRHILVNNI
uniref:HEXIM P-TEFb complex subunit 2 n=1 Tax=Sphenodon punctatus TaxID=8508 RepID=A0A8D0H032_SPHPU